MRHHVLSRFYSRKQGYPDGVKIRYFESSLIDDKYDNTNNIVGKSGKEIQTNLEKLKLDESLKFKISSMAKTYYNWYYYPDKTVFYSSRLFI